MRHHPIGLLLAMFVLVTLDKAQGEIPTESRDKADFVVTGIVAGVYVRDKGHYHHYVIELRADEVAKGKELAAGSTFYVSCFKRKATAPVEPSASGHTAPPKEGTRIKAFVKDGKGKHPAIYPNWFDGLKSAPSE